jgi:ketosteroid isomerase-like protein
MTEQYPTAQDAEDAFYDAIDDRSADRLRGVWEDSADIACLLPMQPLLQGEKVHSAFAPLFEGDMRLDIQVRHIRWLELGDLAIHYVEELVRVPGRPPQPPFFATNVYRKGASGWRMVLHQNSPAPPPPGAMPPGMDPGTTPA